MSIASLDSIDNTKDEEMRREILIRLNVMIEMSTIFRFSEVAFKSRGHHCNLWFVTKFPNRKIFYVLN